MSLCSSAESSQLTGSECPTCPLEAGRHYCSSAVEKHKLLWIFCSSSGRQSFSPVSVLLDLLVKPRFLVCSGFVARLLFRAMSTRL